MTNSEDEQIPLVDDLGVEDLRKLIFDKHGRLFSAAGRQTPVAELSQDALILHPPQTPFTEGGPTEEISIRVDDNGILLDELGVPKKISTAKFKDHQIYSLGECKPGTNKHYAGFLHDNKIHKLYFDGEAVTTDIVYKFRNQSVNGDISSKVSDSPQSADQT